MGATLDELPGIPFSVFWGSTFEYGGGLESLWSDLMAVVAAYGFELDGDPRGREGPAFAVVMSDPVSW